MLCSPRAFPRLPEAAERRTTARNDPSEKEKEAHTMTNREAEEWIARGLELGESERFAEAVEAYDRALALEPDNAETWTLKGGALADAERFDEALVAYDRALALDPDEASLWLFKGNVLAELEREPE